MKFYKCEACDSVVMRWTNELPKVSGWYWWKKPKEKARIVWVCAEGKVAEVFSFAATPGYLLASPSNLWVGPLEPPVSPC